MKICRLPVLPLEVQVIYRSSHFVPNPPDRSNIHPSLPVHLTCKLETNLAEKQTVAVAWQGLDFKGFHWCFWRVWSQIFFIAFSDETETLKDRCCLWWQSDTDAPRQLKGCKKKCEKPLGGVTIIVVVPQLWKEINTLIMNPHQASQKDHFQSCQNWPYG